MNIKKFIKPSIITLLSASILFGGLILNSEVESIDNSYLYEGYLLFKTEEL